MKNKTLNLNILKLLPSTVQLICTHTLPLVPVGLNGSE